MHSPHTDEASVEHEQQQDVNDEGEAFYGMFTIRLCIASEAYYALIAQPAGQ